MDNSPNVFRFPLRVYYEDTDAGGVVYYANYLRYMERCRSEWLNSIGEPIWEAEPRLNMAWVVTEVNLKYHRPARLGDDLVVTARLADITRARIVMAQRVTRGEELLTEGLVTAACMSRATGKPMALPPSLRDKLTL